MCIYNKHIEINHLSFFQAKIVLFIMTKQQIRKQLIKLSKKRISKGSGSSITLYQKHFTYKIMDIKKLVQKTKYVIVG